MTKCRHAAANTSFAYANEGIDGRARGGRASGPASPASRGLSLLGGARAFVDGGGSSLIRLPSLASTIPSHRCRSTRVFFVQSVAGFASFYLRGLSPGASSGGAAAFRAEKSLLSRFSPCICEISTADTARGSICHGHFSPNSTPMPQFSSNWLGTCRSRSADARIATFVALSLSGFCLLSTVPGFLPRLKPQLEPRHPRYQTIAIRSKVGMGLNFKIILKLFSRNFH